MSNAGHAFDRTKNFLLLKIKWGSHWDSRWEKKAPNFPPAQRSLDAPPFLVLLPQKISTYPGIRPCDSVSRFLEKACLFPRLSKPTALRRSACEISRVGSFATK
jgi:hypothetical protein